MVGSLRLRGHTIVADDILAINCIRNEEPMIFPGVPILKLWPKTLYSMGEKPGVLSELYPGVNKRALSVVDQFLQNPMRLRRIYVLAKGDSEGIVPLGPQQAFLEIMRHSYFATIPPLLEGSKTATGLQHSADLCASVSISTLIRRLSLSLLPRVTDLVEEDIASLQY